MHTNPLKSQYKSSGHLDTRIQFHQRFSTNEISWFEWYFNEIVLSAGDKVLDVGCGTASFWAVNAEKIPSGVKLVLVDASSGMIETAKKNLTETKIDAEFIVSDIISLPFHDEEFDIVMANHMLYHLSDDKRIKSLAMLKKVLKEDGTLYASTIGQNHLIELTELLNSFDLNMIYESPQIHQSFGLHNGAEQLDPFFNHVQRSDYDCHLKVTEARPLLDYVLSTMSSAAEKLQADQGKAFYRYVDQLIRKSGGISITKETGYFKATNL